METIRIQDKIISWRRLEHNLRRILELRVKGLSQQEVADRLGVDRTFISRLENLGEIRKGRSIACVGFPIGNREEIQQLLEEAGVDYILLMTEEERLRFIEERNGRQLLDELMNLAAQVRTSDIIILMASDRRLEMMRGMLGGQIIELEIGHSPLTTDCWIDPHRLMEILEAIRTAR